MVKGRKVVALCTSRIFDPHIMGFVDELNKKLHENGSLLLIFAVNSDQYWKEDNLSAETAVFDILPYDMIDTVIIMDERIKSTTISKKIIAASNNHNIPVVVVDGHYDNTVSVNFDYGSGFERIVRHVIEEHKVKHPHMMAGIPGNPFSEERIEIFKKVLYENNIPFDESMLSYGLFWADPVREATHKLLERGDLPEAIICANDIMAINVCDILASAGISVPEQVIVTGFDGYDEVFFTTPKITTVLCNCSALSDAVFDTTLKLLNGMDVENQYIIPELILNESCGCSIKAGLSQALMIRLNDSFYRYQDEAREMKDITTAMQTSISPKQMASKLNNYYMQNVFCVIDKKCISFKRNILLEATPGLKNKDFIIIYDAKNHKQGIKKIESPIPLHWTDEQFKEFIEEGYPLIYNSIDFMGKSLGYVCYFYKEYAITNLVKTATITSTICMGLGGFINMRYQGELYKKVKSSYITDPLTGLYNRTGFVNIFSKIQANPKNKGKKITVIMSDLDGLKYINDNFGHGEGDRALSVAASALKKSCPKNSICVRFGGDELFAVITGACDTKKIISDIGKLLDDYNESSGLGYSVVTSCGANTSVLDEDFEIKEVLRIADEQMYEIKKKHKCQ